MNIDIIAPQLLNVSVFQSVGDKYGIFVGGDGLTVKVYGRFCDEEKKICKGGGKRYYDT